MKNRVQDKGIPTITVDQPGIYRIKIKGRLSQGMQDRFDEMTITEETNLDKAPITTLTGEMADQSALHGLLARIRDLGLPLILLELVQLISS